MRHSGRSPAWWSDGIGTAHGDRRHGERDHQSGEHAEPARDIAERIAAERDGPAEQT